MALMCSPTIQYLSVLFLLAFMTLQFKFELCQASRSKDTEEISKIWPKHWPSIVLIKNNIDMPLGPIRLSP